MVLESETDIGTRMMKIKNGTRVATIIVCILMIGKRMRVLREERILVKQGNLTVSIVNYLSFQNVKAINSDATLDPKYLACKMTFFLSSNN
jgi:polyphosphate kinase